MKYFLWIGGSGLLLFTVFCITDYSSGKTKYLECSVADKHYEAAYTTITTTYDHEGNVHINTTYHPEEWHVSFEIISTEHILDVETSHQYYIGVTNGQYQTVRTRQGKYTGWNYLPTIIK